VKKNIILVVAFMLLIASVTLVIVLVTNNNSKEVKVNYYSNEAALELESEVLTSSSDFILPNVNDTLEYEFIGWYFDETYLKVFDRDVFNNLFKKDKKINLYAKWEQIPIVFTVTFLVDNNEYLTINVLMDELILDNINNPTKTGYNFAGWHLNDALFNFDTPVTSNLTLVAKFDVINVNVKVYVDGILKTVVLPYGTNVSEIYIEDLEGFTFKHWLDDEGNEFTSDIYENMSLYAVYEKDDIYYTVSFITNGGTNIDDMLILEGEKINGLTNPTKPHHDFVGWLLDDEEFNINFQTITSDITLYALWEEHRKVTVTFDFDDPNYENFNIIIYEGNNIVDQLPQVDDGIKRIDYWIFGDVHYIDYPIDHDTILKAVWLFYNLPKYNVTFLVDPVVVHQVEEGKTFFFVPPEIEGFEFMYWVLEDVYFDIMTPITENITLTPIYHPISFNVKYYYNGEVVFSENFNYGVLMKNFPKIIHEGEELSKMFFDEELTMPINPEEMLLDDLIIYVRPLNKIILTFYHNDEIHHVIYNHLEDTTLLYQEIPELRDGDYVLDFWIDNQGMRLNENTIISSNKHYHSVLKYDPIPIGYVKTIYVFDENDIFLFSEDVLIEFETIITAEFMQGIYDSFDNALDYEVIAVILNGEQLESFEVTENAAISIKIKEN